MRPSGKVLAAGLIGAIILGVVLAAMQLDPPSIVHARHLDSSRVQQLNQAEMQVENFARAAKHLPARLENLWAENPYSRDIFLDPETGSPLEYRVLKDNTFELCATFLTASKGSPALAYESNWKHPSGHFWFVRHTAGAQPLIGDVTVVTQ
jgi:hypothetical protein